MKIGDKVKRLPKHHRTFFYDASAIYTITQVSNLGRTIQIVDSDGKYKDRWDADKFEVVNDEPDYLRQFKEANKLIGKKGTVGGEVSLTIKRVVLVNKDTQPGQDTSQLVRDYLKTHEFCVVCVDGDICVPFEIITIVKHKELKISDEYTAQVYKDKVVVGCQTIPIDTVKELIKLSESL